MTLACTCHFTYVRVRQEAGCVIEAVEWYVSNTLDVLIRLKVVPHTIGRGIAIQPVRGPVSCCRLFVKSNPVASVLDPAVHADSTSRVVRYLMFKQGRI